MLTVAVFDYGSGNIRSAERALETAGAGFDVSVRVTNDRQELLQADALFLPGVGAFDACIRALRERGGDQIIDQRLAGGRPVLAVCVGMQILFERGVEHGLESQGLGQWPGVVGELDAEILPHMGWNTIEAAPDSVLFQGIEEERFYFVHSYAAKNWELLPNEAMIPARVSYAEHGERFIAAVENGALTATQFHPEKSGGAGLTLLSNWLNSISGQPITARGEPR